MFKEVGNRVINLKRVKYAGLTLGKLKEGKYRELTSEEVQELTRIAGGTKKK